VATHRRKPKVKKDDYADDQFERDESNLEEKKKEHRKELRDEPDHLPPPIPSQSPLAQSRKPALHKSEEEDKLTSLVYKYASLSPKREMHYQSPTTGSEVGSETDLNSNATRVKSLSPYRHPVLARPIQNKEELLKYKQQQ